MNAMPGRVSTGRSSSTFFWAMRLMPRARREAMFAIYDVARALDDIADDGGPVDAQRAALAAWRRELADFQAGGKGTGLAPPGLAAALVRFNLPFAEFEELIRGMEMDIDGAMRAPSIDELDLYCRRVAGSVGLLSLPVFGCDGSAERDLALRLGRALQLTNILRDVAEDVGINRLYLPREMLAACGIDTAEPAAVLRHPALPQACAALAARAEADFAAAAGLLSGCDRRRLRPALVMMALYRRLLDELRRRGWNCRERIRLGRLDCLGTAIRVAITGRP